MKMHVKTEPNPGRPFLRYVARTIDFNIYLVLIITIANLLHWEYSKSIYDKFFLVTMFPVIATLLVEPLMLSKFQTTIGKFIFNIRVNRLDGKNLTYKDGLIRAMKVFIIGYWFVIPFARLIANFIAYQALRTDGTTSWDDGKFNVTHKSLGISTAFYILFYFVFFYIFILNNGSGLFPNLLKLYENFNANSGKRIALVEN